MTAEDLLSTLHGLDIRLRLDGDRLRYDAPKGALTPELRTAIAAQRETLTGLLRRRPLSMQQHAVWASVRSGGRNKPLVARLAGAIEPDLLRLGLRDLVDRHALLRTRFLGGADDLAQVVSDDLVPGFTVTDAGGCPEAVDDAIAAAVVKSFDVRTGPLLHVELLRTGGDTGVLVVTVHPLLWDGWSRALFVRDLAALVAGRAAGPDAPALEPLAVQYADYAAWQQEWLTTAEAQGQRAYWDDTLVGAAAPPRLAGAGRRQSQAGARHAFTLDDGLDRAVAALARRAGVTPQAVLLATFDVLLMSWTGADDLVVGVPFANRVRPGTAPLIGQFVNTLPVRVGPGRVPTVGGLLRVTGQAMLAAHAHQEVPVAGTGPEVDVTFDYYTAAERLPEVPGLRVEQVPVANGQADFELTMSIDRRPDGVHGTLMYATDVYDAPTMRRLADGYLAALRAIVASADGAVADVVRAARP